MKVNGFVDSELLTKTLLVFKMTEDGYRLVAKKDCNGAPYAMENADKTWSVQTDDKQWVEHDSLHAKC